MKKLLGLAVLIAVVGAGWYFWHNRETASPAISVQEAGTRPDPSNATFVFDDGPVTLKDGESSEPPVETNLTDKIAYGDVNADGKNDAVALIVQSGGGSGEFIYVAAYVSGNVAYKGSNAIFIGDRVSPQSIDINQDGSIRVTYLDRGPNEPMSAEPTILTTKYYVYKSGNLEER